MEPLETGARAHDAPELTEALDVVVVGAAVVLVAAIAVLEVDGSSDTAFVAEVELWAEEDDVAVVDVVAAADAWAAADARAAVFVVAVVSAEPAASKV
ncbi:MAG TPA: hypothetical protein VMF65_00910 [Acidimicrobiales bacterium]|nr:hypothetical protein [Acidimicrobiales bacterium]